jgi:hypothetical protein
MIGLHIGASEHQIHEAQLQRSFSHDFTPFRERMPVRGNTIVSGQSVLKARKET